MSHHDFDLHAGTNEFYLDTAHYDYEFRDRTEDVKFYVEQYQQVERVLELGVGTGRIALKAVKKGANVTGLDLHEGMLKAAQTHREKLSAEKREKFQLIQGDMRYFDLQEKFDLITCPFNAFQHLYEIKDVNACLQSVKKHLLPKGKFILDVLMPDLEYLQRPSYQIVKGIKFFHPVWQAEYAYSERSAYDPVRQINQVWIYYDQVEPPMRAEIKAPKQHTIQLSHRYFFPMELEALLMFNGFKLLDRFGGFQGEALGEGCESQVLICENNDVSPR